MLELQLRNDIKGAIDVINLKNEFNDDEYFSKYCDLYFYNNESINLYFRHFNYSGNILSVASSGDHMLHSIYMGATDITLFDINRLTKYFCALKLAGIKTLTYDEFFDFFGRKEDYCPNFKYKNLYDKLKSSLENDDIRFWNALYKNDLVDNGLNLFDSMSFCNFNIYYEDSKYYELQKKAKNVNGFSFIESNVLDLPSRLPSDKTYSSIFLSNIDAYIYDENYKKFKDVVCNDLFLKLDNGGLIAYGSNKIQHPNSMKLGNKLVLKK